MDGLLQCLGVFLNCSWVVEYLCGSAAGDSQRRRVDLPVVSAQCSQQLLHCILSLSPAEDGRGEVQKYHHRCIFVVQSLIILTNFPRCVHYTLFVLVVVEPDQHQPWPVSDVLSPA